MWIELRGDAGEVSGIPATEWLLDFNQFEYSKLSGKAQGEKK